MHIFISELHILQVILVLFSKPSDLKVALDKVTIHNNSLDSNLNVMVWGHCHSS